MTTTPLITVAANWKRLAQAAEAVTSVQVANRLYMHKTKRYLQDRHFSIHRRK